MIRSKKTSKWKIKKSQVDVLSNVENFFYSCVLFALLNLNIFERIDHEIKSITSLASELDAKPETLLRLLNAGVCLNFLETEDGQNFSVAENYRDVLTPTAGENYLGNWIRSMDYYMDAMSRLDQAVLNSGPTIEPTQHLGKNKKSTQEFMLAMHNYALIGGKKLVRSLDTSNCKSLLDIGCGPGTYSFQLGQQNKNLLWLIIQKFLKLQKR